MEILEIFLAPIFELVFGSKKVNIWAKSGLFLVVMLILPVVLICLDVGGLTDLGKYIMYGIASVWAIAAIIVAIWGHKTGWKKW